MSQFAKTTALSHPIAAIDGEFQRYFLVSAVALAVDFGLLLWLTAALHLHILAANALAFLAGSLVAYLGSAGWAFRKRRFAQSSMEVPLFVAVGLVGLGVNEAMLWSLAGAGGLSLELGKSLAAAASFGVNFGLRKLLLFR